MAEARDRDIAQNRRAFHDYHIDERVEAGLALIGSEVKSLRDGRAQLKDSYARFFGDELFLVGAHISPYAPSSQFGHDPTRSRKLLLHRREIEKLRGKKLHDKREAIRERTERREVDRALAAVRRRRS